MRTEMHWLACVGTTSVALLSLGACSDSESTGSGSQDAGGGAGDVGTGGDAASDPAVDVGVEVSGDVPEVDTEGNGTPCVFSLTDWTGTATETFRVNAVLQGTDLPPAAVVRFELEPTGCDLTTQAHQDRAFRELLSGAEVHFFTLGLTPQLVGAVEDQYVPAVGDLRDAVVGWVERGGELQGEAALEFYDFFEADMATLTEPMRTSPAGFVEVELRTTEPRGGGGETMVLAVEMATGSVWGVRITREEVDAPPRPHCESTELWVETGDAPAGPSEGFQETRLSAGCVTVAGTLDPDSEPADSLLGDTFLFSVESDASSFAMTLWSPNGEAADGLEVQIFDSTGFIFWGAARLPDNPISETDGNIEPGSYTLWVVRDPRPTAPIDYQVVLGELGIEIVCDDLRDDDQDFYVDCADPDCCVAAVCGDPC